MNHSQFYLGGLDIGGHHYTQQQVYDALKHPVAGDMTYAMLAAVVVCQLSLVNGGVPSDDIYWEYANCNNWMHGRVVGVTAPVLASSADWQDIEGKGDP